MRRFSLSGALELSLFAMVFGLGCGGAINSDRPHGTAQLAAYFILFVVALWWLHLLTAPTDQGDNHE